MNTKFQSKTQEYASRIAEEIAKLWDAAIMVIACNDGELPSLETVAKRGKFLCYPDGRKEFQWDGKVVLVGNWIDCDMSQGYEIKPVIKNTG